MNCGLMLMKPLDLDIKLVIMMIGKVITAITCFFGGNLMSWSSSKQKIVSRSSTESTYRALIVGAGEVI